MLDTFVARPGSVFPRIFYAILFCVGIGSFFVHEFAHWLTGVALGHDMHASPNHVWPSSPTSVGHQGLIAAAGPLVTIAQGVVGLWLIGRDRPLFGFSLLYMAFFMRLLATVMSLFNPNDEARVSQWLGLGTWTLPIAVVLGLFILLLVASRRLKLRLRDQFFCFVVASAVVTMIVGADSAFGRHG